MVASLHQKAVRHRELVRQPRPRQIQAILEDALLEAEAVVPHQQMQVDPASEPATAEGSNVKGFPSQLTSEDEILVLQLQLRCHHWFEFRWLTDDALKWEIEGVGVVLHP